MQRTQNGQTKSIRRGNPIKVVNKWETELIMMMKLKMQLAEHER